MRQRCFLLLALLCLPATLRGQDLAARIEDLVRTYHEQGRFSGAVLVGWKGRVIYKEGMGYANAEWKVRNGPGVRVRIGSLTKAFTAMLVLQLVDEGKLRLGGTISEYLPRYPLPAGDHVTLHQLLSHTSGIPDYVELPLFQPVRNRQPTTPAQFLATFDSLPFNFAPGRRYGYSNSGYFILGVILEQVTGRKWAELLRERILVPLGMKQTGYDDGSAVIPGRAEGYLQTLGGLRPADFLDMSLMYSAAGMYSTLDDLWRFDRALSERKLLSDSAYALMEGLQARTATGWYGYGWAVDRVFVGAGRDSLTSVSHVGGVPGFTTANFRLPEDDGVILWYDNTGQVPPLSQEIVKLLYGVPVVPPRPSIARALLPVVKEAGVETAIRQYRDVRARRPEAYDFAERELNQLGYALLRGGAVRDAVAIFTLNTEMYPGGSNTYDSLGEALLAAGDTAGAVANYRRSLAMNAGNTNATRVLARLGQR